MRTPAGNNETHRRNVTPDPRRAKSTASEQTRTDHTADPAPDSAPNGISRQANSVEITIGGDGSDPFDATLYLACSEPTGEVVEVWTRLTPPTIADLIDQLDDLLLAQEQALGITGPTNQDEYVEPSDRTTGYGGERVKRFLDPLGLRHLKARSTNSTVILAAAIASLVVLAVIVQLVRS